MASSERGQTNVIDPASLVRPAKPADWRRQGIRPEIFTSAEVMRAEAERLWPRVWMYAGSLEEIAKIGDYLTVEMGSESIVVVRAGDDRIHAFYNVCQHRGHPLLAPGTGNASAFRCPFHMWTYALDGALRSAPGVERFSPPLEKDKIALKAVRTETWGPSIWINLSPEPEPLAQYLGTVAEPLDAYHLEEFAVIDDLTVEAACNWKLQAHAQLEFYHVQTIHRPATFYCNGDAVRFYLHGRHSQMNIPFGEPSPHHRSARRAEAREAFDGWLHSVQIDKDAIVGDDDWRAQIQRYLREGGSKHGFHLDALGDDQLSDVFSYHIFPNVCFGMCANMMTLIRYRPHVSDPGRSYLDHQTLMRVPRGAARPPRPKRRVIGLGESRQGLAPVIGEDLMALEMVQRSMRSRGFDGPHLFGEEMLIQHFHERIDDCLRAP